MQPTELLKGKLQIYQPKNGYKVAFDPLLIATTIPPSGKHVLDMGTGVGTIALGYALREPKAHIDGVEQSEIYIKFAQKNVAQNNLPVTIHQANCITWAKTHPRIYDRIAFNPPYEYPTQTLPQNNLRQITNVDLHNDFRMWCTSAIQALAPKGVITLIHKAERLNDIITAFGDRAHIMILPVYGLYTQPCIRILCSVRIKNKTKVTLLRPFVLNNPFNQNDLSVFTHLTLPLDLQQYLFNDF